MTGQLLPVKEALSIILDHARPLGIEDVDLGEALGRVLAHDVKSLVDMPRFDNSAMDGYAVRSCDTPGPLELIGSLPAGDARTIRLREGTAVQVFTGGPLPEGADAVVMQEEVEALNGHITSSRIKPGENVRYRAEEIECGQGLASTGSLVTPALAGLLASAGHARAPVYRRPQVTIVTTGDELVAPGRNLAAAQIYRSNDVAVGLACAAMHFPYTTRHAMDDPSQTRAVLEKALAETDVLITLGGVSVGAHDHVKEALASQGVEALVWGVAVKPGQPFYFGTSGEKLVFGLPGNPVSALTTFYMLARPGLLRLIGLQCQDPTKAQLSAGIDKKLGRLEFVRGVLQGNLVTALGARGSHMMGGLANANSFIHFPAERDRLEAGETVDVTEIRWGLV